EFGRVVGDGRLDVALDDAASHVRGVASVAALPLVVLAHVYEARAGLEAFERLFDINLADASLRVVNDLQESFGVLHAVPLSGEGKRQEAKVKRQRFGRAMREELFLILPFALCLSPSALAVDFRFRTL